MRICNVRPFAAGLLAVALLAGPVHTVQAQLPDEDSREAGLAADTGRFRLYSDFRFNLHDFLHWRAQENGPAAAGRLCLAELEPEVRRGWEAADTWYRANTRGRDARTDPLLRSIRVDIADLGGGREAPDDRARVYELLRAAAPAYRACFWEVHDTRNRAWIASLEVLLERHQDDAIGWLERAYQEDWPGVVPIDVVGYSNWAGANTTGRPLHMLVSAADPDLQGPGAFEIVLHEASHGVIGPGFGSAIERIDEALESYGLEAGRDVWHGVLFFTAGRVAQELLASSYPGYVMYMNRGRGLYPDMLPLLQEHWDPYLAGEIDLDTAAERLAAAVAEADDGA